jgi:hypothetical protein
VVHVQGGEVKCAYADRVKHLTQKGLDSLESVERFFCDWVPQWELDLGFQRAVYWAEKKLGKNSAWTDRGRLLAARGVLQELKDHDQLYWVPLRPCSPGEALADGFDDQGFQPGACAAASNLCSFWQVSSCLSWSRAP